MLLTNKYNIAKHIYDKILKSITDDPYKDLKEAGKVFRVTELLKPPLMLSLKEKYRESDKWVIDASHYLPMLFGTSLHTMVEGEDTETVKFECRVSQLFDLGGDIGKVQVVGTIDELRLLESIIFDNKTSQVSSAGYPVDSGYVLQLNIYAYMAELLDAEVKPKARLFLRYFYKDWTAAHASRDSEYPQTMLAEKEVVRMTKEVVEQELLVRLTDHLSNPDRPCTQSERCFGRTDITYAVMGAKKDRAMRVFSSMDEAQTFMAELPPAKREGASIDVRGTDSRCKLYCDVRSVCSYAQGMGYVM
jgi:hypothetical protein